MTYLLIIMLAPSPIPSQIPHTLFHIISLGAHAVLCHDQDTSEIRNETNSVLIMYNTYKTRPSSVKLQHEKPLEIST